MEALLSVFLLLANGFFVGAEFAIVAARPAKLELMRSEGSLLASLSLKSSKELSLTLSGAQLGITMASLGLGYLAEPAIASALEGLILRFAEVPDALLHTISYSVSLTLVVYLHMVIGEIVPKNMAIASPEKVSVALAIPLRAYTTVFRPLIWLLTWISNHIQRWCGVEPVDELSMAFRPEEIAALVAQSREGGILADETHDILEGALSFSNESASKVMIPWSRVVKVDRLRTVEQAEQSVLASGHSRLIAMQNGSVLGFVHAKDLLKAQPHQWTMPVDPSIIRELLVISASEKLGDVMVAMRRARTHIALVVEPDGTPAGIVTLEDVLEQVVGDIRDEHDPASDRRVHRRR